MHHIFDVYGAETPNYARITKWLELFGDQLSYKNLSGGQMMNIFFKKFFPNRKIFKKLINIYYNTESAATFEHQVKELLATDHSKSSKRHA